MRKLHFRSINSFVFISFRFLFAENKFSFLFLLCGLVTVHKTASNVYVKFTWLLLGDNSFSSLLVLVVYFWRSQFQEPAKQNHKNHCFVLFRIFRFFVAATPSVILGAVSLKWVHEWREFRVKLLLPNVDNNGIHGSVSL